MFESENQARPVYQPLFVLFPNNPRRHTGRLVRINKRLGEVYEVLVVHDPELGEQNLKSRYSRNLIPNSDGIMRIENKNIMLHNIDERLYFKRIEHEKRFLLREKKVKDYLSKKEKQLSKLIKKEENSPHFKLGDDVFAADELDDNKYAVLALRRARDSYELVGPIEVWKNKKLEQTISALERDITSKIKFIVKWRDSKKVYFLRAYEYCPKLRSRKKSELLRHIFSKLDVVRRIKKARLIGERLNRALIAQLKRSSLEPSKIEGDCPFEGGS